MVQIAHKYSTLDRNDCFAILPLEILQEILVYLPSKDVLNLKLTSAAFAATPLSSVFWASRFQYGFEFHCVFETQKYCTQECSWKSLYLGVRSLCNNSNFRNRCRIWKIILQLEELLLALSSVSIEGSLSRSFFEPDVLSDCMSWTFATGLLREPEAFFNRGCRALWT